MLGTTRIPERRQVTLFKAASLCCREWLCSSRVTRLGSELVQDYEKQNELVAIPRQTSGDRTDCIPKVTLV